MRNKMLGIALTALILTLIFNLQYQNSGGETFLTAAITCGTITYHFGMRLSVGAIVNAVVRNRMDYNRNWFQLRSCEKALYEKWNVKTWKQKLPTYDPSLFSLHEHSFHEIAQAMCQAEVVHELIIPLSFLPLLCAIPFGAFPVFLITSFLSAAFDSLFVIVQRYNRPRMVRLALRTQKNRS